MLTIIDRDLKAQQNQLQAMRQRAASANETIELSVRAIMENVKAEGLPAVERYTRQFDHKVPYEISREKIDEAYARCPKALVEALERAAENIREYNRRLLPRSEAWTSPDGGKVGRLVRGLSHVGIYVPGGTAAYPSSVLMNAVPAKVAGVEEIIMVTPPTEHLSDAVLAAAKIAGVDRVIAVGGAQAVAALTYGAGFIPKVDKLVGPGNAYVAAAKRLAYGQLDIDMIAGPSEVLVIADETADPKFVAADLLSQAEHDVLASAVLLTDSTLLAQNVAEEIEHQCARLSRRDIIDVSLRDFGCALVSDSIDECVSLANQIAPEHLELCVADPNALLPHIKNAGAVFLGDWSPESLGDYMAGPNHVLPTSGTARFFSPLSVTSFIKTMSVIGYGKDNLAQVQAQVIALAQAEGLTAHANSIQVRFEGGEL